VPALDIQRQVRPVALVAIPGGDHPARQVLAHRIEDLDAPVPCIGHEDAPVRVDGQADRLVELPGGRAAAADVAQPLPLGGVDPDALVAGVGHVDQPVIADGDGARPPEVLGIACGVKLAELPPGADELALRGEDLDTVIPRVGHIDVAIRADGHTPRLVEVTAGRRAVLAHLVHAPAEQEVPFGVKCLDAVVEAIGDVQRAVQPDRQAARVVELPFGASLLPPDNRGCAGDPQVGQRRVKLADDLRPNAQVPDLGGHVLAHVEVHAVRDRPLAQREVAAGGLPVGSIVTAPPDVPQSPPQQRRVAVGRVEVKNVVDPGRRQVEVVLHRPPHPHVLLVVVAVAQQRLHLRPRLRADHHRHRLVKHLHAGIAVEVDGVGILAEVPASRPRHLVVVGHANIHAARHSLADLLQRLEDRGMGRPGMGVNQILGRQIVIDERRHERRARGEQHQQDAPCQDAQAPHLPPADTPPDAGDGIRRAGGDQHRRQPGHGAIQLDLAHTLERVATEQERPEHARQGDCQQRHEQQQPPAQGAERPA